MLPFAAEHELPENLKALIATGEEEEPFDPAERNFYDLPPHLRRQARAVRGNVLLQEEMKRLRKRINGCPKTCRRPSRMRMHSTLPK